MNKPEHILISKPSSFAHPELFCSTTPELCQHGEKPAPAVNLRVSWMKKC